MATSYEIRTYGNGDTLPSEAEALFERQLSDSRQPQLSECPNAGKWTFALTCAETSTGHVLGGVYLDVGPIGGTGPIADKKLAYLERSLVRPEHRRQGIATTLLKAAIRSAANVGCEYIRCSNNWDNPAETALFLKCGFALVDLDGEEDEEPCYLAVRSLQNLASHSE
jgi:GNAT superfamily N-acetyltransferase